MAQIDVLRPVSTRKNGASSVVPSGTRHGVTSDDSDATYISFDLADTEDNWNLRVGSHTLPANHQRHRIRGRIRIRCNAGFILEDIDIGKGAIDFIEFSTVEVSDSFTEGIGSWFQNSSFGLSSTGTISDFNIGGGWPHDDIEGANELRTAECYIDIDCRARPDYSPEVRDAAGADQSSGTVADTRQPTLFFGGVSYDGLPALDWSVTVGSFSSSGSGTPPTSLQVSVPLDNGSHVATFTVRSTIRGSDPFTHQQVINFDVDYQSPTPSPPILQLTKVDDGVLIEWSDPGGVPWTDNYAVAEVWREDCTGEYRIGVFANSLNGSLLDTAIPQLDPKYHACPDGVEDCTLTYKIRYWGYVDTSVVPPDNIPSQLILAWPGTVASIPTGWTRVTALDGLYPRGSSAAISGATGGASTHSHTTTSHSHNIGAHSHPLGGTTSTSNLSETSGRSSSGSLSQADQPHNHTRSNNTMAASGSTTGTATPGTASTSNDPLARTVIWISSDGARTEFPVGILGFSLESISDWTPDFNSFNRFLKGANTGADGGSNIGGSSHFHSINAHTHTGITHNHNIADSGLSQPTGINAFNSGSVFSFDPWLAKHRHPMVTSNNATGSTNSSSSGNTSSVTSDPPNRRLQILRNTAGGLQTRIIGLYRGDIASLDSSLTRCDGSNGTTDMRDLFGRDRGSASINQIGGNSTHMHSTPLHQHTLPPHDHSTIVQQSTSTVYTRRPTSGDLGDSPAASHGHSSGATDEVSPVVGNTGSGANTNTASHIPPFEDVHYVRLDGAVGGDPIDVPELKTTEFAEASIESNLYDDGLDRITDGEIVLPVCTDRNHEFPRNYIDSVYLEGGPNTVSTTVVGERLDLVIAIKGYLNINQLEELLSSNLVYYSPLGGNASWYAPAGWSVTAPVRGVKVLIITLTKQDWPTTPEPGDFL